MNLNTLRNAPTKPSPATSKLLGMRMTTLHEEPLGVHRALAEEPEDSYSDSEYTAAADVELEKNQRNNYSTRSRLTSSKTMDSFMDVSNYTTSHSHTNHNCMSYTSSANANMKHLTGLTTPSMSSSTSSGYGSQAVSCSNLSNDDIASLRSMSIEETSDFDRINSNSPPNRQARFNPFLKDMPKAMNNKQKPTEMQQQPQHPNTLTQLTANENANRDDGNGDEEDAANDDVGDAVDLKAAKPEMNIAMPLHQQHPHSHKSQKQRLAQDELARDELHRLTNNTDNSINNNEAGIRDAYHVISHNNNNSDSNQPDRDNQHNNEWSESNERDASQHLESTSIVKGQLPSMAAATGKVVRRKKTPPQGGSSISASQTASAANNNGSLSRSLQTQRASFNASTDHLDVSMTGSMEAEDEGKHTEEVVLPDWVVVGESVLIRPYNSSGIISYIGTTHFQAGTWIGVELDTPTGKNDGTVQGLQYFQCKPKHGIFVRFDKLILDKRGKAMRAYKAEKLSKDASLPRSKSRNESLSTLGVGTGRK